MALVSGRSSSSTLNPNAPLFVPAAFRQVEDFSPEWWHLITTSTWYHDYWISQNPDGLNYPAEDDDVLNLLPDSIDVGAGDDFSFMESQFEEFIQYSESEANTYSSPMVGKGLYGNDSIALKSLDYNGFSANEQYHAKYLEKPGKTVTPKYSPRCIQQPR